MRLVAAFDVINDNFKSLFEALFGGGQAELKLVESDDPLEAGLEIYACPPGKRLAVMSLMSGGEQALTAANGGSTSWARSLRSPTTTGGMT